MTSPDPANLDVSGLDQALAAVSGDRMAATVAKLAADRFAGRRVGSPGAAAAREWLVQQLTDLHAAVTTEPFPVAAVPEIYAAPTVHWHDGTETHSLTFGSDVAVHLTSADQPSIRRGRLTVAGHGDPAGAWLVVPAGTGLSDAYGQATGAAGLLLARQVDADGWQYTMLAGPPPGPLPVLSVAPDIHTALHEAAATGTSWLAGNAPIRRVQVTATNLHARWDTLGGGADLLLTAHCDGVGDLPGLRQPAAADNGSGVAVVLETARILTTLLPDTFTLAVALLDAEETGALGSAQHATHLRQAGHTPLVINVDGAGHLHQAVAVEAGGPAHALLAALDQAGRRIGLPLAAGPVASDNRRYAAAGLAAVGIGAGMAGHHSPADIPDRVDTSTLTAIARLVVATAWLAVGTPTTLSSLIGD